MTAADRHPEKLAEAYEDDPAVRTEYVDLTDDDSIAALARRMGGRSRRLDRLGARSRKQKRDNGRDGRSCLNGF